MYNYISIHLYENMYIYISLFFKKYYIYYIYIYKSTLQPSNARNTRGVRRKFNISVHNGCHTVPAFWWGRNYHVHHGSSWFILIFDEAQARVRKGLSSCQQLLLLENSCHISGKCLIKTSIDAASVALIKVVKAHRPQIHASESRSCITRIKATAI